MPDALRDDLLGPTIAVCVACGGAVWERDGEDFLAFLERYRLWSEEHARCATAEVPR